MSANSPGLFIAIEGIDGSGTTTHCQLLVDALRAAYPDREVLQTREPSHTPVTTLIRQWLSADDPGMPSKAMCLAFVLDRYIHLREVVEPALARGAIVVCDRYKLSTLAYQTITLPKPWVHDLTLDHRAPDLYVFLSVDPNTAMARVWARSEPRDRYEQRLDFQARVARQYTWALQAEMDVPQLIVETDGRDIASVFNLVRGGVRDALEL